MAFTNISSGGVGDTVEVSEIESLNKGAIIAGDGDGAPATLAAGNDGEELVADSNQTEGVKWLAPATAAEINTGTDTEKRLTPDALAGSNMGEKSVNIVAFDSATDVATGDGKAYLTIPSSLDGMNLVRAQAIVITAGTTNATTVMIHNVTDAADMLSGAISIASGNTVGTVGTIDTNNDDVATDDVLRVDVDSVSSTAPKGLIVILEFRLP